MVFPPFSFGTWSIDYSHMSYASAYFLLEKIRLLLLILVILETPSADCCSGARGGRDYTPSAVSDSA